MKSFDKFPLASPGLPYLGAALFMAVVATALDVWWMAVPLWLFTAYSVCFFRDPARFHNSSENQVISPADGKVVLVGPVEDPRLAGGKGVLISIFMNLFNVHVNRIPIDGRVASVQYHPGLFMPADREKASRGNERMEIVFDSAAGSRLVVAQVAGLVARRIHCSLGAGDNVIKGHRFGMIRFGSRLDVYLPQGSRPTVEPGERVKAGVSIIGELVSHEPQEP